MSGHKSLNVMSDGYKIRDQQAVYFVTFTIVDWVDLLTRESYRDVLLENLNFYHEQRGLCIYAYVVMSNHMHLILQQPVGRLSNTVRDYKKYTSRIMAQMVMNEPESRREWLLHRFAWNAGVSANVTNYQVWVHDSHAEGIWTRPFYEQKERYIHMNSVRAGWVEKPEDWVYSSAYDRLQIIPKVKLSDAGW
jgi:REP element-mobilizing transposase RayT